MASRTGLNTTDNLDLLSVPEQSIAQEVVGLFCMVLLTLTALVANTVVMIVILKTTLLRKFIFVCHLCAVDLLSAIFLMPLGIISSSSCFSRVIYSIAECQGLMFLNVCFISASILTISIISVERYYYIVHPMRVYRVARMASLQHAPVQAQAVVPRYRSNSIASQVTIITTRNLPLPRLMPERFLGSNKAILTLVLIVGQFLCCWLPFFAFHLHSSVTTGTVGGGHGEMVVTWIAYSSFAINPFFYGLLNRQIREELARFRRSCLNRPLGQELCLSVSEASVQENILQFLQRATCTLETHASCISPSPRNRLDQTKMGFPIPGQVPEESS
ncbi:probable G-protein coupled receptor isoform X2 [Cuculus canorus]|uniref:probable G-protein coupled receptor isoform X2 n=1 Tax=Cuculus canorus TaxID=55661 RepID=UPI0023AAE14D|nr:probable G-protein coupled receptor isoform X2 [Cuculus canorus]